MLLDRWFDNFFHAYEKVDDLDAKRLRHELQARERDIHPSIFERTHLGAMKARKVRKFILSPPAFNP